SSPNKSARAVSSSTSTAMRTRRQPSRPTRSGPAAEHQSPCRSPGPRSRATGFVPTRWASGTSPNGSATMTIPGSRWSARRSRYLVCGWTIAGWAAAILFSIAFPRSRDVRARALAAAEPSASALPSGQAGDPESRSFIRDPLTVGVLTFIGSGAYYFWWCWQFFKLAKRERFPRARSFWWFFVPLYGLAVMFRIFEDLELRLSPKTRGSFDPRAAIAMVIAGNMCAAFSARLAEPAGIGLFFVGGAFFGAALYMVQGAANGYLYATYPGRISKPTSCARVTATLIGVALPGLSVA